MKKCRGCQLEKEVTEFNKRTSNYDGYDHRCRECLKIYIKNLNSRNSTDNVIDYKLIKENTILEEKVSADCLLKNIGYKLDSEFTIHEQFMMKHNLV
jgi:hypothetical protein